MLEKIKGALPFSPDIMGAAVFIVSVAAAVYVARKLPVLKKLA